MKPAHLIVLLALNVVWSATLSMYKVLEPYLEPGGIVLVTLYPGHEGGGQERIVLEERLSQLPPAGFHVWRMGQINVPATAPYVILIQKVP